MSFHDCIYNCGATDCPAPTRILGIDYSSTEDSTNYALINDKGEVIQLSEKEWDEMIKEAAINEIKAMPYFRVD